MGADTGSELKILFSELVALAPPDRAERLSAIGQHDPALRDALQGLLAADERGDKLLARLDSAGPPASLPDPYGLAGQTLGHFRVVEVLGAGGMGVVYRAEDLRLGREVALKLLPPHLGVNPDARRLFLREARAAAALDHPNIATVFEVGEAEGGQLFHATALYRGETLRQRLARGPLPLEEAEDIARQVLRGLGHAHAAGVVHRDLKPENLVVTPEGVVKIVDFGLATLPGTTTLAPLHGGTAAYMAPEQLRGEAGDARSDLWALGVVFYEMVAGRRPFQGESGLGLAERILNETPAPLSSLRPEVAPRVENVVERLLRREPSARPASAEAVLQELEGGHGGAAPAPQRHAGSPPMRRRLAGRLRRHRWPLVLGAAAVVVVAALLVYLAPWRPQRPSIAVLPFTDLNPDSANPYLGDGIAEQVLFELGQIDGVRTVAWTSSLSFRGQRLDVRQIGRKLGVATVVEGNVDASGDRIRVSADLVRTADGSRIWSERYDRPRMDRLALQDDIAGAIATALAPRFGPSRRAPARVRRVNLAASDLYVEGSHLWIERTPASLVQAADRFRRALALDTTYALAWVGLADVYAMLGSFEYAVWPPQPAYEQAKMAARKALQLEPDLGQAHAALANIAMNYDRDWGGAEREFRKALQLSPDYAPAHQWYAFLLVAEGRNQEALRHLEQAGEADPLSPLMVTVRGQYFYFRKQYDLARGSLDAALRLDPNYGRAHLIYALVDMQSGHMPAALARLARLRAAAPDDPVFTAILAYALGRARQPAQARALEDSLTTWAQHRYVPPELHALAHIGLGENRKALDEMEQAFRERSGGVLYLRVDPLLDPLRGDPRFQKLLQKLPH